MKARKPLRRFSKNRSKLNKVYSKIAKEYVQENPLCAIRSPNCTGHTQCVHHGKGRVGFLLIAKEYWFPSCFMCNGYVEENKKWAIERGFRLDRLGNL